MSTELRIKAYKSAVKLLRDMPVDDIIEAAKKIYKFISADGPDIIVNGGCCPNEEPPLKDRVFTGEEAMKMCLENRDLVFNDGSGVFSKIDFDNTVMVLSLHDDDPSWSENGCAFLDENNDRKYRIWYGGEVEEVA